MGEKTNPWFIVAIVAAVFVGVLMSLGIIAAIAVPDLLDAIDRAKLKRTVADMQTIGLAIEAYAVDHDHYPMVADLAELKAVLEPRYIKHMPETDSYANRFVYEGQNPRARYVIRSNGRDGVADNPMDGGPTTDFDCDVVFAEGEFVQWPKGFPR
jgi:type II secretory pathway pseudopilin PulG